MKKITILFLLIIVSYVGYGQTKIKGFISDEMGPLPGANILIKNSNIGVVSNFDGYYEIQAKASDTLSISFVGYNTQDVLVANQKEINTFLEVNLVTLDEVVIVGYAVMKKSYITRCYGNGIYCDTNDDSSEKKQTIFKSDIITQKLYPNPSKGGQFKLDLLDDYNNVEIQVTNMSGQIIKTNRYKNAIRNVTIDLSGSAIGMYIIKIIVDGEHLTTKKAIIG